MLIMKNVILALRSIEAKNRYFCQLSTLEECLFAILHNQYTGDHAWLGFCLLYTSINYELHVVNYIQKFKYMPIII